MADGLAPLVRRAQSGDREALSELCRQEWTVVYRVVGSAVADRRDVEELTQETFVRALSRFDAYTPSAGSFRAYLVTVAKNLVRDRWRSLNRAPVTTAELSELPAPGPSPEADAISSLESAALAAALGRLPVHYQHALRLRLLERRPSAEVAALLGRSPEGVRQLQHRALAALRSELANDLGGESDNA